VFISSGYFAPAQAAFSPENPPPREFPATPRKSLAPQYRWAEQLIQQHKNEEDRLIGRWRDLEGRKRL
jgi:hypothetical protein